MRKYCLWKFGTPVSFEDEDGHACDLHPIEPVEEETWLLVDIIECFSIQDMADEVEAAVRQDMEDTYQCQVSMDRLSEPENIQYLTDEVFQYEMIARAYTHPKTTTIFYGVEKRRERPGSNDFL